MKRFLLWVVGVILGVAVLLGAAVGWFLYAASVSRFFRWTAEKIGNYRRKKETDNG